MCPECNSTLIVYTKFNPVIRISLLTILFYYAKIII